MFRYLIYWITAIIVVVSPLYSSSTRLLGTGDISQVMKEIFDQHIVAKEVNVEIIEESFQHYLESFDPDKIYLLEEEVRPFLDPTPQKMADNVRLYHSQDYSPYREVNSMIQRAIARSHLVFEELKQDKEVLFKELTEFEESPPYAKNREELKKRLRADLSAFISYQMEKWGAYAVLQRKDYVLELYQRERLEWEAPYLFQDVEGAKLDPEQENHQFSLHILKALAKSLDAHTAVFDGDEALDMKMRLQKGYEGTGVIIDEGLDGVFITALVPGSPAERIGEVKVGDIILAIDGISVGNKSFRAVTKLLEGEEGTSATLILNRDDGNTFSVTVRREVVLLDEDRVEVSYEKFGDGIIGKIVLHSFYQNRRGISSEKDIRHAIQKLKGYGPLRGLILDLRENSGGYLSQAVKVAGLFVTNGVIVISKYHDGEKNYYRDLDGKTTYDGPLIVLTSRLTASAAEIVAQALQDWGVAVIVGDERTYGKGSIQSQTVTDDSSSSYFKVTVGQYYTVSGKSPQTHGVKADIVVPGIHSGFTRDADPHALVYDTIEPAFKDPLNDVKPHVKGWYLRYYMPTIQSKKTTWKEIIPLLRAKSYERLKVYSQDPEKDIQMIEAIYILKDMVHLSAKLHRDYLGAFK